MTLPSDRPLSVKRRLAALTLAAIVGVALDGIFTLLVEILSGLIVAKAVHLPPLAPFALLYMLAGSCVAVPLCWLVGMPLWARAERAGRRGRRDAFRIGCITGTVIGSLMTALQVIDGIDTWADDRRFTSTAVFGIWLTVDGVPTVAGWLWEIVDIAHYAMAGGGAGLVAHRMAFGRHPR